MRISFKASAARPVDVQTAEPRLAASTAAMTAKGRPTRHMDSLRLIIPRHFFPRHLSSVVARGLGKGTRQRSRKAWALPDNAVPGNLAATTQSAEQAPASAPIIAAG